MHKQQVLQNTEIDRHDDEIEQQELDDFRQDIDSEMLAEALATIKNSLND